MAILVAAMAAYNGGGHACGLVLNCSKIFFKKRTPKKPLLLLLPGPFWRWLDISWWWMRLEKTSLLMEMAVLMTVLPCGAMVLER